MHKITVFRPTENVSSCVQSPVVWNNKEGLKEPKEGLRLGQVRLGAALRSQFALSYCCVGFFFLCSVYWKSFVQTDSGVARLYDVRDGQSKWPSFTFIISCKKSPLFIEFHFMWLNSLKTEECRKAIFYLIHLFSRLVFCRLQRPHLRPPFMCHCLFTTTVSTEVRVQWNFPQCGVGREVSYNS